MQFKFAMTYVALILGLLLLLNTYPMMESRNLVFYAKQTTLMDQALEVSRALSGGDRLERETVGHTMGWFDIQNLTRIVVINDAGAILYDTVYGTGEDAESPVLEAHLTQALAGYDVFVSQFTGGRFYSWGAAPIMSGDRVIGAVYLHEQDQAQGELIAGLQRNLLTISMVIFVVALFLAIFFSRTLTRRLMAMLAAIRIVGRGDYSYKLAVTGEDELAELGQAFNRLTDRLQETEEVRRRFVSDASHELKTPLASIRLLSDSIVQSRDMDVETVREFVEDIGQEAERLGRTTEKLLQLTRLDVAPETELVPVDVAQVVTRAGYMLRPLAQGRQVEMQFALQENCKILATEDDVYQIVFNLAENGIKYNTEGGLLKIRLEREADTVRLVVEDTGIGIPEADMAHIFDRFYRVDKARSRGQGSSGLGLAIVRDTALCHGGTVEVAARDDGGGTK
ncbi:MAG: HAMP domain-containing histidine kinase, partial [Oscillospiraceae bacterium]|nr:HAMP domain-containing histidine kinase [Oscillospiraceae bacterium]